MIVVDANVLLYAVNSAASHHRRARSYLESALNGDEPVGLTWMSLLAFIRVATLSGLTVRPLTAGTAFEIVEAWLTAPAATVLGPTSRHAGLLKGLLTEAGTAGNLTNDAHLAAIAIEHGARLCTFDRDFGRFAGLDWFLPGD